MSAGHWDSLAVGTDGDLYAWGFNGNGELGDGTTTERLVPELITLPGQASVATVSAGAYVSFAVASTSIPRFIQASPPATVTAGFTLNYRFIAASAQTYGLSVGAPAWLSIDSTTGHLSGTVPNDISSFVFSVTATNVFGVATAGPFTVVVTGATVSLSGTASDNDGNGISGAVVDVCQTGGGACTNAVTGAHGAFTVSVTAGSVVTVTVYPPPSSELSSGSTGSLSVPASGLSDVTVDLPAVTAPPGLAVTSGQVGTTAGGGPILISNSFAAMQISGCQSGTGLLTLVGQDISAGAFVYNDYPLTETPAGSGNYDVLMPPQNPIHGPVDIESSVTCAGQPEVEPAYGPTGGAGNVTISGTGLTGATDVQFGTNAATDLEPISDDLLTVTSPPGSGTVPVTATLANGSTESLGTYTYVDGGDTPNLNQDAFRASSASGARLRRAPDSAHSNSASVTRLAVQRAGLSATDSNSTTLATVTQFVYKNFPGDAASTLRSAVATALNALHPTCDSNRAALKGSAHLLVSAGVSAAAAAAAPGLVLSADALLSILVDPIVAALLAPAVAALVKAAVAAIVNSIADALIDAAIDAALGPCPNPHVNALIDPSGSVLDTNGNPVSGASVTIMRSDTADGTFTPVDVTLPGIEPATNPETTAADGVFHWDVDAGFYEVSATKNGCTAADGNGDDGQPTALIGPYPVPPPQVGLIVTLACPGEDPAPLPAVSSLSVTSGDPAGGTDLIVSGTGFAPGATVTVGGIAAAHTTYLGPDAVEIHTPARAPGVADVVVQTAGGDSATSAADKFFYGTTPAVNLVNVASGPVAGGTRVTVTGSGFTGATVVGFGGVPGTNLSVDSDTKLEVTTPKASTAGPVDVEVVTPVGANPTGEADVFTYQSKVVQDPTITPHLSSPHPRTRYGWYRSTVTVTFVCTTHGAPLTSGCPARSG